MNHPFVTCIMPTANRPQFLQNAIENFLAQDYINTELLIIDDGIESNEALIPVNSKIRYYHVPPLGTIGIKRNFAVDKAEGVYIVHWDDDDRYAVDWISRVIQELLSTDADITGLSKFVLYSHSLEIGFNCKLEPQEHEWVCGATMAYKRSLWQKYHFKNLQIGEDTDFQANSGGTITALDYTNGFMAVLHSRNTSIKYLKNMGAKRWG